MGQVRGAVMVGREPELSRLGAAMSAARTGEARCVLVLGEAGIGKSRLVSEALSSVVDSDALVVTGHAADMSTGEIPFGVVADTLRDLLRAEGPGVLTAAEREVFAPLLPGESSTGREIDRVRLLSTCVDLVERLASRHLLVWVVEDLHWADAATRDLLGLVVRTVRGRLLVVVTVRTDDPERSAEEEATVGRYVADLARLPQCDVQRLDRLGAEQVHEQLVGLLEGQLPAAVVRDIERLSDGIPFVVEELAAAQGRPELAAASAVGSRRVASLSAEGRRLVEALAIGDGHLRLTLVEQVVDATAEEFDDALAEAVAAGVLLVDPAHDGVRFRHDLLRHAVDRDIGPGGRRSWHRRWAEVLESNPGVLAADPAALAVAEHWHQARDVRRSVSAAYDALPAVQRIGTVDHGAVLWTRIMAGWRSRDPLHAVGRLSLREAVAHGVMASFGSSLQTENDFVASLPWELMEAPELAVCRAMDANRRSAKGVSGGMDRVAFERLLASCDWTVAPSDLLTIIGLTLSASRLPYEDPRAEDFLTRARQLIRELGHAKAHSMVLSMDSWRLALLGRPAEAADELAKNLSQVRDGLPTESLLALTGNLIWSLAVTGRHEEAQVAAAETMAQIHRPEVIPAMWEHFTENITFSWICTGEWSQARQLLERGAPVWEDDLRCSSQRLTHLDLIQKGAADVGRWAAHAGTHIPWGPLDGLVRHVVALEAAMRGDLAAARRILSPAWEEDPTTVDDTMWQALVDVARLEADAAVADPRSTDRDEAATHMATLDRVAASYRPFGALGTAWRLDLVAQQDRFHGRDARPALEAALAAWAAVGHRPDVAATHLSLAEAHARHGDRASARQHLGLGRSLAAELLARPLLRRADTLAERHGLSGAGADSGLTTREAEVLALVAAGRTNNEIAEQLFMSPKTASVHVSRLIAKLGAANRTEAAAIARHRGLVL